MKNHKTSDSITTNGPKRIVFPGTYKREIQQLKKDFRRAKSEDRKHIRKEIERLSRLRIQLAVLSVILLIVLLGGLIIALPNWLE